MDKYHSICVFPSCVLVIPFPFFQGNSLSYSGYQVAYIFYGSVSGLLRMFPWFTPVVWSVLCSITPLISFKVTPCTQSTCRWSFSLCSSLLTTSRLWVSGNSSLRQLSGSCKWAALFCYIYLYYVIFCYFVLSVAQIVKAMLHWSTSNADSQRMFLTRTCRHVTLLNCFQKLAARCSTANIAKNRSQRAVTLEWFFAQHRIIASWRCKLTSVTPPLGCSAVKISWSMSISTKLPLFLLLLFSPLCLWFFFSSIVGPILMLHLINYFLKNIAFTDSDYSYRKIHIDNR